MVYLFTRYLRRHWLAAFFSAAAIGVAACSNQTWGGQVTPDGASHGVAVARPQVLQTPIAWGTWYTVNDTALPGSNNTITGIQDLNGVVGVNYGNSSGSVQSFDASPAPSGYANFKTLSASQTSVTYLWGRANASHGGEVGDIVPQGGQLLVFALRGHARHRLAGHQQPGRRRLQQHDAERH